MRQIDVPERKVRCFRFTKEEVQAAMQEHLSKLDKLPFMYERSYVIFNNDAKSPNDGSADFIIELML